MEFIKDCCLCIYWNCCPCGWSNGNAACITIQKPNSTMGGTSEFGSGGGSSNLLGALKLGGVD